MLSTLPRDILLLLARYVPASIVAVLRVNRTLYGAFRHDTLMWTTFVTHAQRCAQARKALLTGPMSFLQDFPQLKRVLPVRLPMTSGVLFAVSSDAKLLACQHSDTHLAVFSLPLQVDAADDEPAIFQCLMNPLRAMAFSPNSSEPMLACLSQFAVGLFTRHWCDCAAGRAWQCMCVLDPERFHLGNLCAMVFIPTTGDLAVGTRQGSIAVWNLRDEHFACLTGRTGAEVMALVANSTMVASDKWLVVQLWALDGKPLMELAGHIRTITGLCFAPDDKPWLVSSAWDGTVRVWNTTTGECIRMHDFNLGVVQSVALSANSLIAAALPEADTVAFLRLDVDDDDDDHGDGDGDAAHERRIAVTKVRKVQFAASALYLGIGARVSLSGYCMCALLET